MSRKTFVIFGLLVIFLAVLIPWLAFRADGDPARGAQEVPSNLEEGQTLFKDNCGNCHTLYAAGTDGNFGPDLDTTLAEEGAPEGEGAEEKIKGTKERVLDAIKKGVAGNESGRMPPGILSGEQAEEVAEFVATTAGRG